MCPSSHATVSYTANSERSKSSRLVRRSPVTLALFLEAAKHRCSGRTRKSGFPTKVCRNTHARQRWREEENRAFTFPISISLQAMTITCNTDQTSAWGDVMAHEGRARARVCVCVDLDVILPDHPPEVRNRGAQRTLGGDVSAVACCPLPRKRGVTRANTFFFFFHPF